MCGVAWINVIDEDAADERLRVVFEHVRRERGRLSNVFRAHSLNPEALDAHLTLYMTLMFGESGLSRAERELIASVVSATNRCLYCTTHHREMLVKYVRSEETVREILERFEEARVSERERALIRFVRKLTQSPSSMSSEDVEMLRKLGTTIGRYWTLCWWLRTSTS
ncbi:MAG: peroxidase-related enzyme [Aigarchaeota archaeon]|nr:peroxidase-related enzyme [Candidatus Pelearchaeum maunauluense]